MAGLQIFPEDFGKIGLLVLNKGKWNGEQIISENWLNFSVSPNPLKTELGLLWWLLYEKQFMTIDDGFLNKVKPNADTETFETLQKLKGKYESFTDIQSKLATLFDQKDVPKAAKAFSNVSPAEIKIENEGEILGYIASGYLGQNLIILPKKNIVVVRMISSDSFKKIPRNSEFTQLRRLVKQL